MSDAKLALPSKEVPIASPTSGWLMAAVVLFLFVIGILGVIRLPLIGGRAARSVAHWAPNDGALR